MKLSEKHEKAADLAGRLSNSLDLQDIFPNIFDLGGARACVYSTGQRGRPMFRLTRGDGTKEEMPLVNAPTVLIRHYSCLIRLKAKEFPVVHRDWKICEKVL